MKHQPSKMEIMFVGLPESGKSTYIAAFWNSANTQNKECLEISNLPNDTKYLETLAESWRKCEPVVRTVGKGIENLVLEIKAYENFGPFYLAFPDLSGETYKNLFKSRVIEDELARRIQNANALVLFIRGNQIRKPEFISEVYDPNFLDEESTSTTPRTFTHDDATTQIIATDLLQLILEGSDHFNKIAVIISAWDKEVSKGYSPRQFTEEHLPLVFQYLWSNFDPHQYEFFGISAQGGDYEDESEKLLDMEDPSERIIAQVGDEINSDISMPIKWIMKDA